MTDEHQDGEGRHEMASVRFGQPIVLRGPLVEQDRARRAQLAAAEEADERGRMLGDMDTLRAILTDLRGSRAYKLMRRLGRWGSIERGMRRARIP